MKQPLATVESLIFYSLVFFLPMQLGKHFWPGFSSVMGIRIDYLSPTIYLTDILLGILFICWLYRSLKKRFVKKSKVSIRQVQDTKNQKSKIQFKIQNLSYVYIYVFIVLLMLVNVLISGRIMGGLYSLLKFLEMSFLAYYSAKFIINKVELHRAIAILSVSVIFQSVLAAVQYLRQASLGGLLYFFGERFFNSQTPGIANASLNGELVLRPYGTFPHPNVLAGYLLIAMIFILFFLQTQIQKIRSVQISALAFGTIALFLTMSRVAILLWILVLIYYLFFHVKKRLLVFIFVGLGLITFLSPIGARFTGVSLADESITQRSQLIESSVEMVKASPLLGVGLGNFLPILSKIQDTQQGGYFLQPVHNIFLLAATEVGLIVLGFFLWFLWKTMDRIKKQELRIKEPLLIMICSVLIIGLFDHYWLTLQQGQLLFVFVVGLCWADIKNSFY